MHAFGYAWIRPGAQKQKERKMNNRLFLYSAFIFVLILLVDAWDQDYSAPKVLETEIAEQTIPETKDHEVNKRASASQEAKTINEKNLIDIKTDTLKIKINLEDGSVVYTELLKYPISLKDATKKIILFDVFDDYYIAKVGLQSKETVMPKIYSSKKINYTLGDNDNLKVELVANTDKGFTFIKNYTFSKNSHLIEINQTVVNNSNKSASLRQFNTLERKKTESENIMLYTYTGAAYYDEEDKFNKIEFDEIESENFVKRTKNGWISMIEHYFFSAWVPYNSANDIRTTYTRKAQVGNENTYLIGSVSDYIKINPNTSHNFKTRLFVGPKNQEEISGITPGLELTVDYGTLTFLAAPLFWILEILYFVFGNWGWAIIALTFVIKLLFYKLSETSYKSMAKMKKLNPRMQMLKERYGDDRKKFSEALMQMYKEEKVNPLGGCLPILIQIPVFIALYWVLIESVEMRQAPFIAWIKDLSSADPLYILPIAMGISMYIQQKLNPAPTDEMQQKIFMVLPFLFTFLFATFPSGLVLYWLTNNILSIAQQYVINKRIVNS
tara:strand:- start:147445 stop:149109 length:1665 start_codon:yes stop_codon:yes gene_type:complete